MHTFGPASYVRIYLICCTVPAQHLRNTVTYRLKSCATQHKVHLVMYKFTSCAAQHSLNTCVHDFNPYITVLRKVHFVLGCLTRNSKGVLGQAVSLSHSCLCVWVSLRQQLSYWDMLSHVCMHTHTHTHTQTHLLTHTATLTHMHTITSRRIAAAEFTMPAAVAAAVRKRVRRPAAAALRMQEAAAAAAVGRRFRMACAEK